VLIGADSYPPDANGTARFTHQLARGLAARGHDVHVLYPEHPGHPAADCEGDVCLHALPSVPAVLYPTFRISPPPLAAYRASREADRIGPDIVHVQGHLPIGRSLIRWAQRRETVVVATNHFMADNMFAYIRVPAATRRRLCRLVWRDLVHAFDAADVVTTPTTTAARLMRDMGLQREIEAVSCGVDLSRFRPGTYREEPAGRRDVGDRRPSVLFVGRLEREKRLPDLIAALAVVRRNVDARLLIAGAGSQRRALEAMADRLGLGGAVRFLGRVPDERLPSLYAGADVFCMPSVAELQSMATLEAMASARPIVAADAMALPQLVRPGVNGYLYPPGDSERLAELLAELLQAPRLRERMGAESRRLALLHDVGHTVTRYEEIYRRALLLRGGRAGATAREAAGSAAAA
jgi:glycosyltransferase involved in cell wall biosynthesis